MSFGYPLNISGSKHRFRHSERILLIFGQFFFQIWRFAAPTSPRFLRLWWSGILRLIVERRCNYCFSIYALYQYPPLLFRRMYKVVPLGVHCKQNCQYHLWLCPDTERKVQKGKESYGKFSRYAAVA